MSSLAAEQVISVTELLENILSHLPIHHILLCQRICRTWYNLINTSPVLLRACWFTPDTVQFGTVDTIRSVDSSTSPDFQINPCVSHLGIQTKRQHSFFSYAESRSPEDKDKNERGVIDLRKLIYEKPGSWTGMFVTQPPCRYMQVECYSNYTDDETMYYLIESPNEHALRLGDLLATLAEAQNRQTCGVDRWAGIRHILLEFYPTREVEHPGMAYYDFLDNDRREILDLLPAEMAVNVAVTQAWDSGTYPAFSLRRLNPAPQTDRPIRPSDGKAWRYEMNMHAMIDERGEYIWEGHLWGQKEQYASNPLYKNGHYAAQMLLVPEQTDGYLSKWSHVYQTVDIWRRQNPTSN
jgi:hypothetical protein